MDIFFPDLPVDSTLAVWAEVTKRVMPLLGHKMPEPIPFRLGPFVLRSEIDFPELPRGEPDTFADVVIRLDAVPSGLHAPLFSTSVCEATAREYLLRIQGTASYYVRDGAEVVIQPEPDAPALDVRAYLLGSIFAVLCHQRGLLPLHGSAIATAKGAVAFLGESGAGKSSLAAFLGRRGHRIVADDICLVDPDAPLPKRVLPVAPWLKLWRQTLDQLGEVSAELPQTFSSEEKFRLPLGEEHEPLPLAEVILLAPNPGDTPDRAGENHSGAAAATFRTLGKAEAVEALMRLTYRGYLPRHTGQMAAHFQSCGRALAGVRTSLLSRPWGFAHMNAVVDAIEAHVASQDS